MSINKHYGMMIPKEEKKMYLSDVDATSTLFIGNACKRTLSRVVGLRSYKSCGALRLYMLLIHPVRF